MDLQQMLAEFLESDHGAQATQALAAQGVGADDAQQLLRHAAGAAYEHVEEQSAGQNAGQNAGLLGDHSAQSFFAAFAAGLVRGDGFFGSLMDGGEGVMSGRVAEAIAARAGVDASTASALAAAATPYVVNFLKHKLG